MRLWVIGFTALVLLESCCRYNHSYYVSDFGKSWIEYAGTSGSFKNDLGELFSFSYSTPVTTTSEGSHGEECGDYCYIEEITFSLTDLSIDFMIYAANSCYGSEQLKINCENSQLYLFRLVNDTAHNMISYHPLIYHNHLSINGKEFEMVYEVDSLYENPSSLVKCYFNRTEGIVGYETADGKIWCLQ